MQGGESLAKILNLFNKGKKSLDIRLENIKNGDSDDREALIEEYTPFIIKTITKVTNRYIETENDDEYSVGLQAFNDAIDKYNSDKGSFINFAALLIRNKVIDFLRKETPSKPTIYINDENEDKTSFDKVTKSPDFTESYDMKEQILRFQSKLAEFDITMEDLVENSPKHIDTRLNSIKIARYIFEDIDMKKTLYRTKSLPVKRLLQYENATQKILKRNRKFIIATFLVLDSDADILKSYLYEVERRD